ncbi:hypothetical protein AAG906_010033 [Vitis piasezkii]
MWVPRHLVFLVLFLLFSVLQTPTSAISKSYVVYLGSHSHGLQVSEADFDRVADCHHQFLASFLGSHEKARDAIFYSYRRHINGFAAILEEEHAAEIARDPSVVSVFLNRERKLHTTHSWDFMLMEHNGVPRPWSLWRRARFGMDTIIANLDTGVWPESKSFSDRWYGPVPARWKGICENDTREGVPCNRKLIGARYFNKGYSANVEPLNSSMNSARDYDGHGTHTLSTAAGNFVPGASVYGVGKGTAKGGSPHARVAAYKVCWPSCYDSDIMAAFDMAIHDGVDVISMSLGGDPSDYFDDGIAIGAFHAVKNNILVVSSAGNSGPSEGSVSNTAPWMFTVGASTMDRKFQANVQLKNGTFFEGMSLSQPLPKNKFYSLISGAEATAANATSADSVLCLEGTLDPEKVKGKILVCLRGVTDRVEKGLQAAQVGAVGMILCNDEYNGNSLVADPHFLPATHINYTDGLAVLAYINSTKNPQALITPPKGKIHTKPAPVMAAFSSRGPNTVTPEILKPDITAPGVDIIAAFTEAQSPTEQDFDERRLPFYSLSGTSMSCPHVAGVAGLLKTIHPHWSPSAIKSAIMTTASTSDNTKSPLKDSSSDKATPLAYGAGHMQPNQAADPGLVYDLTVNDYLDFLCALGYNQTMLKAFSDNPYKCPASVSLLDFNYPSITVPNLAGSVTLTRRVTNVGFPGIYAAHISQPTGVSVTVEPSILKFSRIGEEKKFKVTLKANTNAEAKDYVFGQLIWTDDKHHVRSPIVVAAAA